jgi:sugar phosphate permease
VRFNLKAPRIFYGWWIVAACFVIGLYLIGVVFYGFTAVFEPVAEEFGWSYTQVSLVASIRGLEAGLLAPLVGILVDRWGPRRLMFGAIILAGLGLILFSQMTSLLMFYVASVLMAVGISASGISVTVTTIAHWFRKRAGLATGILVSGYGASGLMVPVVVGLVDAYDWRTAVIILAVGMLIVGLPLSLVVRHKPEQYGYLPDGEESETATGGAGLAAVPISASSITARQAMRSRVFWLTALALIPQFISVPAVVTHVMPYLSSIDIPRSTSGLVATAIPLLSVGGRFGFGWFADKFNERRLSAIALVLLALGLVCFEFTAVTLLGVIVVRSFGRGSFGAIIGWMWGVLLVGTVLGPTVAGWVYDNWGSYQGIWMALAGLSILGATLMLYSLRIKTNEPESGKRKE